MQLKINLKKRLMAGVASVGIVAMTAGAAHASELDRLRWQVPMSFASTLTALGDTMPWVADQLRAASGGQIDFRVAEPAP